MARAARKISARTERASDARKAADADEPEFRPVFLALVAASVLPLWVARFLPMVDLPGHLALINVLHHLHDPSLRFGEFFAARPEFTPYLGFYWTVHLLSYVLPVEVAARLFLTAYAIGLPVATLGLVRALGRSRWLALFALPLTYTFELYIGFINYIAALALLVGSLAVYAARLRGRFAGRGWDAAMVLLPLACMATHVQPYSFFVAGLAVMLFAYPGFRARAMAMAAPSLALFLWWMRPFLGGGEGGVPMTAGARSDPFATRVGGFSGFVLDEFTDGLDTWILVALAAVWTWGLWAALRGPRAAERPWRERLVAPVLAAGAIGGYFLTPTHMKLMQFIHPRYATLSCLLLAAAVPLAAGAAPRAWRNALIAVCGAASLYLVVQFRRFESEAGDFRALAEKVAAGSCVAGISGYFQSGVVRDPGAYYHFPGYVSVWRGALPGYTFADTRHSPLFYKRRDGTQADGAWDAAMPFIPEYMQQRHLRGGSVYPAYGGFYRYFLVPKNRALGEIFGPFAGQLGKLGESGTLALYENPAGRCGQ